MAGRKKGEKVTEELEGMLAERGGKPWLRKNVFPKDDLAKIDAFLKKEGGKGYIRLAAWGCSRELKKKKPDLYFAIQKFLFEAGYPKKLIEGDVVLPIRVMFELVRTPQELEKPSLLTEGKVIEIKDEDFRVEATDTANAVAVD